jgi:hypothetical protein
MQLRPVFLLAPEPERRPTRRRFVAFCATFAAAGGVLGFAAARWTSPAVATPRPVDPRIAWARRLAVGPLESLWSHWDGYLAVVAWHGGTHRELWRGVRLLAECAIAGSVADANVDRALVARYLVTFARSHEAPADVSLDDLVPRLVLVGRDR